MEITDILDQETLDAIYADAAASGISASDVKAVLGTLTDDTRAPSRSANSQGELMSLLDDDKDAVVNDIADATGVERGKTSTILMLAAPFLLKYLFSSGSAGNSGSNMNLMLPLLMALMGGGQQQSSGMGLLGSLLGGGQPKPQQSSLLGALLGGGQQQYYQQSPSNSLFSSLLGAQPQQNYSHNSTTALLNSLMGSQTQQQVQAQQVQQSGLLDLLSGNSAQPQIQQPQQSAGGGLLSALFNLLGDN